MRFLKYTFSTLIGVVSLLNLTAQDKFLSIEDCFNPKYYPQSLRGLQWIPDDYRLCQVKGQSLVATNPYSLKSDTLVTLNRLANLVSEEGAVLKSLPPVNWRNASEFWFVAGGKMFTYNINDKTVIVKRKLSTGAENLEVAENSLNAAYTENSNIYVSTVAGIRRITEDGGNGIVYGQAVHRNEFGINKGFFWNSEGNRVAFYRMDERRVSKYPMFDVSPRPAKPTETRYPMAGDSSHTVTVGIYNTISEEIVYLKTEGPYDQYLTNITWSPDGEFIYLAWVSRNQKHMQLRRYNAATGILDKVIYEEKHAKYVEPENPLHFIPGSNDKFIWFSEKDGFNHLYLFQDKKEPVQVTKGNWVVTDFLGFSKDGETLYYESTQESPLQRHAYALKLKDKNFKTSRLTKGKGVHKVSVNHGSGIYLDVFSNLTTPKKYQVFKLDGTEIQTIFDAPDPVSEFKLGEVKLNPILSGGVALWTRTFLPPDFNPQRKYPVIVYVYGGPHAQMINETWLGGGNLWMHYMAQNGYVVFTLDNRGSSNRGFEFESATHKQLGTVEMEDQLAGIHYLKQFDWVDTNRIGVHGWSFGGFMTTSLMTRKPGVFNVGVAGGPVIDWKYYEIMYTERYMETPQSNPEGYKNNNLLNYVGNLNGRLLMIHGADDDVVVWQHSLLYVKEAVKNMNVNLDYYVYPGHKHNVVGPDRAHLYKKISQYFFDFL